jgi:hypothetical protein
VVSDDFGKALKNNEGFVAFKAEFVKAVKNIMKQNYDNIVNHIIIAKLTFQVRRRRVRHQSKANHANSNQQIGSISYMITLLGYTQLISALKVCIQTGAQEQGGAVNGTDSISDDVRTISVLLSLWYAAFHTLVTGMSRSADSTWGVYRKRGTL